MIDESGSEKILFSGDLQGDKLKKVFYDKKIVLSGSFEKDIWSNLSGKIPEVEELSLRFVNQPTFVREQNRKDFLLSLKRFNKLTKLSLENQFFIDEDLKDIPDNIKYLNLTKTEVFGYGLEYLPKDMQVTGINK
jgi:hypothetical protein